MNQKSPIKWYPSGFALPMSIIAVAGLLLLLVGLLTVMSLERKTARSYSDAARAEFAVESGLASAILAIGEVISHDDSLVFRLEDPIEPQVTSSKRPLGFREQFFTYGGVFKDDAWLAVPLFSGAPATILGNRELDTGLLKSQLTGYVHDAVPLGQVNQHDQNIPRAKWVDVPHSDPKGYTMRYAYWIEDLGVRVSGKITNKEARADGLSTTELDVTTILDPQFDSGQFPAAMNEKRDSLRTSGSLRSHLSADQAKRIEPYIHYYAPPTTTPTPKLIPQGFGYPDAGQPAPDLNELVSSSDVEAITDQINRNLPNFDDRKGGFPDTEDYVKTIAASIVDYADVDSDATLGTSYRGVDSYPFVNELFDRYEWVSSAPGSVSIDVDTYLEIWNPSDQEITGNIRFNNINKRQIKLGGNGTKDFSTASFGPLQVTIPPNGFRVIPLGKKNYSFAVELEPVEPLTFDNDDSESSFELFWNDQLIDQPRGGVERTYSFLRAGLTERRWKGNSAPPNNTSIGQLGDPRASFYLTDYFRKSDYDTNSNWGGRALRRSLDNTDPFKEVRLEKWPDRGSNSTAGIASGTDPRVPTETNIIVKSTGAATNPPRNFPPNQPELAPARISNSGRFDSLGELGNVFDPAQWLNLEKSSASASSTAGGGITLAVGRPEYAAFDEEGRRASQLLDLFSLEPEDPVTVAPININTAPREVLRALLAGVVLDEDPVAPEIALAKAANEPAIGDIFADQVIAYRNSRPLRSASDLNLIRGNPLTERDYESPDDHPFFGNPENYLNVPTIPERSDPNLAYDQAVYKEWNDSGREELFRKVMDLVSYRSNVFRIIVAGEIINSSGERTARSVREFHIELYPQRNNDGLIIPDSPLILRKFYERSL